MTEHLSAMTLPPHISPAVNARFPVPLGLRRWMTRSGAGGALLLLAATGGQAATGSWQGQGAPGGTGGTDYNNTANWTLGDVSGNFGLDTTTASITMSADNTPSSGGLNFTFATTGIGLTINSDTTGTNRTLNIGAAGIVENSSGTITANNATIGTDVTLAFGSFTAARTFGEGGVLTVNGLVSGTGSGSGVLNLLSGTLNLNDNSNTFVAPINLATLVTSGTILNYTSIGNVNGGASSLGAPTSTANGTITLYRNAALSFVGATSQSSNRVIAFDQSNTAGPRGIFNLSTAGTAQTPVNLTLSADMATGAAAGQFNLETNTVNTGLTLTGVISGTSTSLVTNINPNTTSTAGLGTVTLSNAASTYVGATEITGGTLSVSTLANGGSPSSIGESSNAASNLIISYGGLGATLQYTGGAVSTDRLFQMAQSGGSHGAMATIDNEGTGALQFTNTGSLVLAVASQAYTLTLTGPVSGNTFAPIIPDPATSMKTSFTKAGSGSWTLSGASSYSGTTTVSNGTLGVDSAGSTTARLAGTSGITISTSGMLQLVNSTSTVSTDRLNDAATLTLSGGTLNLGGLSEGAAGNTGLGALTLTGTSKIDFGPTGTSNVIQFAGVTSRTGTLQIIDWESGSDHLYFAGTVSSFTSVYTSQSTVSFNGTSGFTTTQFGGYYEISGIAAVPEPSTLVGGFALTGLFGWNQRRRFSKMFVPSRS